MAVSSLKKMSILAEKEHQETILTLLQNLQVAEIEDSVHEKDNADWLATYFPEINEHDRVKQGNYVDLLTQIQAGIRFVRNYGSKKQAIQTLKRAEMNLLALEETYDEKGLKELLENIHHLKQCWEENGKQTKYWQKAESWGTKWQGFALDPEEELQYVAYFLGKAPNDTWEEVWHFLKEQQVYVEIHNTEKEISFSCLFMKENKAIITQKLTEFGVLFETNPYDVSPEKLLKRAKSELDELASQQKAMVKEIGIYKQQVAYLQLNEEILLAKLQRETVKEMLARSNYLVVIRAWVAEEQQEKIQQELMSVFSANELYFAFEAPDKEQIEANQVPTKLKNAKIFQPFESLIAMYALPKYEEIDPTPWMAPFYLVFFGMMVADLGYGLLMLIGTTIALKINVFPTSTKKFIQLFQLLSLSVIAWGIIYGSAFGVELPFKLLSPTEDFMTIFMLSVAFGVIQIFTGLFLAARENIKRKDYLSAIGQGFSWIGILSGIFVAVLGALVLENAAFKNVGIGIAIFSAFLVVLIPVLKSSSKVGGFFSGIYELYGITGYIGDFVSYSRLMALGISGGSIAMAFNMLVGTMPPAARFSIGIVLIVILQALNIFLSILGAYVHAARLQYVEFFGKFYEGGGKAFQPFKAEEKYMNIHKKMED